MQFRFNRRLNLGARKVFHAVERTFNGCMEPLESRVLLSGNFPNATDSSMAYDSAGRLHMAYFDANVDELFYSAQNRKGVWSTPTEIAPMSSDSGHQISLAISSTGTIGVAYYGATQSHLKYAQLDGSAWKISTVDANGVTGLDPEIGFLSAGNPAISYYNQTSRQLEVAISREGGWRISMIENQASPFSSVAMDVATQCLTVAYSDSSGNISTAAIGRAGIVAPTKLGASRAKASPLSLNFASDGRPAVAYLNPGGGQIRLAQMDSDDSTTVSVLASVSKVADADPSLLFTAKGAPQVIYYDGTQGAILLTKFHPVGSTFQTTPLQYGVTQAVQNAIAAPNNAIVYAAAAGAVSSGLSIDDTATTPAFPTNVAANPTAIDQIQITWTAAGGSISGYVISRSSDGVTFKFIGTAPQGSTSYTDTGLTPDATYYYQVSSVGTDGSLSTGLLQPGSESLSNVIAISNTFAPASISGYVYLDNTLNGMNSGAGLGSTKNPGATSAAPNQGLLGDPTYGISTQLTLTGTDALGNVIAPLYATSDPVTGAFSFGNLDPGTYTLTETPPVGYLSAIGSISGAISNIVVAAGANITAQNFGEIQPVGISGSVYNDANDNGTQDAGEVGISGVSIYLNGTNDLGNSVIATATTANDGSFSFAGLRPGTYKVSETSPIGYLVGKQNPMNSSQSMILSAGGDSASVAFGELMPSSIGGFVYNDVNDDGALGTGDLGIAGVSVALSGTDDMGHSVLLNATSAADGSYAFTNLRPGTYTVTETAPSGYLTGNQNASGVVSSIVLPSGTNQTGESFAELLPSSLSGFVYNDANGNGVFDAGESGVAGVTMTLTGTDDHGNSVNMILPTGVNGSYDFTLLRPGIYTIAETPPTGYQAGTNSQGTPGNGLVGLWAISTLPLPAGVDGLNNNFAIQIPAPTALSATLSGKSVQLSWTETSLAVLSFIVERSVDGGTWTTLTTTQAVQTSIVDSNVSAPHQYQYRVTAVSITGNSLASSPITAPALIAPSTPINLAATAVSDTEINLTWDRVGTGETSITVLRSTGGGAYQVAQVLPAGSNIWTDTSLYPSTSYSYEVTADNGVGSSLPSVTQAATTQASLATLPAAQNFAALTVSPFAIQLTWASSGAGGYWLVERSTDNVSYTLVTTISDTGSPNTYTDTLLSPSTIYYYRIRIANNAGALSNYTSPISATTQSRPANAPVEATNFNATVNSATSTTLSWTDTNNDTATYLIETAPFSYVGGTTGSGGYGAWTQIAQTAVGANSYSFTTTPETFYYVRIRAKNSAGDSGYTAPVTVRSASPGTGTAKIYAIGPGEEYTSLGSLNWALLGPGDTVEIFPNRDGSGNIIPYYEKPLISVRGTAAAPIDIVGMPDPTTGQLPIIDGTNAVDNPQWAVSYLPLEDYSLVLIGTRPTQAGGGGWSPGYLNIENLEIRNGYTGDPGTTNTYVASNGTVRPYADPACGIYIEDGDHITIQGCSIHGNNEGVFGAGQGDQRNLEEITLNGNYIYNNGAINDYLDHNTYLEGINTTYEFNEYGPTRPGSAGSELKDRGAGTIIRYNSIAGGARMLDLVQSQNYASVVDLLPSYHFTYVYGNIFNNTGNDPDPIHYGGDSDSTDPVIGYRGGVLYFYNNTFVSGIAGKFTVFDLSTPGESVDAWNNIFASFPPAGAGYFEEDLLLADGIGYFGPNWISPGWKLCFSGYTFAGHAAGVSNLLTNAQNDPGFVSKALSDFDLSAGAAVIGEGAILPDNLLPVLFDYVDPLSGLVPLQRQTTEDLGAFEFGV